MLTEDKIIELLSTVDRNMSFKFSRLDIGLTVLRVGGSSPVTTAMVSGHIKPS